ncbi:hypothetical protein HZ326_22903 [Fusarium oxysporum f. sp. albedinis]|nr:hypothetical protein HZ326_22903 [Fusarium oxysporum f. sp. albedinis]KAK2486242.1 hypothetical protein H9L39_00169 [Fusarium oxysporum f. sp. albedinis]
MIEMTSRDPPRQTSQVYYQVLMLISWNLLLVGVDHRGQAADIWEAKMSLLVRYGAIDKLEPALFYGTLEALR